MEKIKNIPIKYNRNRMKEKTGRFLWSAFRAALLIGIGYIIIYPILFMISTALRGPEDYYNPLVVWLPLNYSTESFKNVLLRA